MPFPQKTLSPNGLDLIKKFESFQYRAYLCPANKLTIGYGHVLVPGFDAVLFHLAAVELAGIIDACRRIKALVPRAQGLRITHQEAVALLSRDSKQVALFLNSVARVELNQNQFDALCSLIFNIGQGAFAQSTLRKLLFKNDFDGAAAEFDRWAYGTVNGKKQKLPGLVKRRAEERELFERPVTG